MVNSLINFLHYVFNPLPGSNFAYYIPLLVLGIVGLIGSIVLKRTMKNRKEDKIFRKIFKNILSELLTFSVLTLIYTFCRWQNIYLFSMRFLIYSIAIWGLVKLIKALQAYYVTYPEMIKLQAKQAQMNKYLQKK